MKLSDWCKAQGITYRTGWNWFKECKMPVTAYKTPTGTIIVQEETLEEVSNIPKECYIYCRVSTPERKKSLELQVDRCTNYANANGFIIKKIIKEIASGMNDKRSKLIKMLEAEPHYIIVENKDRLTRFGFNYLELLLNKLNSKIIVINESTEDKEDLMKDFVSIITSFCGRLYGQRRSRDISHKIKDDLPS
jgi:predicted site-specific integrase-resolvase